MARAFASGYRRRPGLRPILIGVASETSIDAVDEIAAPFQPCRSNFKFAIGERALAGANDWSPSAGECNSQTKQQDYYQKNNPENFGPTSSCHESPVNKYQKPDRQRG